MGQIANYVSLFSHYNSPKDILEQSINCYLNNFKSSTFYLNDLTESFKFTNGIHQRNTNEEQLNQFKEAITSDIDKILNRYFDSDSIINNTVDVNKEEIDNKIILFIKLYIEVVVDGLSYTFKDNYSIYKKGG